MVYGFFALATFDFRGAAGGNAVQFVLAALCLGCVGLFALQRRQAPGSKSLQLFIIAWWSFLGLNVITTIVGVSLGYSDASFDNYVRLVMPYVLAGASLTFVQTFVRKGLALDSLIRSFLVCALISLPFHMIYARIGQDIEIDQLRFQALTPFVNPTLAAFFVSIFLQERPNRLLILVSVLTFVAILISITRAFILVGAIMMPLALFVLARQRAVPFALKFRRAGAVVGGLFGFVLVVTLLALAIRPNTLDSWSNRFKSNPGQRVDPSVFERQINSSGIQIEVQKNLYTEMFGKGFGGSYLPDLRYAPEWSRIIGRIDGRLIYGGMDSRPMNSLLFTGLIGSAVFTLLFLWAVVAAWRALRYQSYSEGSGGLWSSWPLVYIIGGLLSTFLSYDLLGARADGLMVGLMFGVALACGDGRLSNVDPTLGGRPRLRVASDSEISAI